MPRRFSRSEGFAGVRSPTCGPRHRRATAREAAHYLLHRGIGIGKAKKCASIGLWMHIGL